MWNVEQKTLDYFPCVPGHDLGYLGPVSPNCPNNRVPVKQYNSTYRGPWHYRKVSFDVKQGAEDFWLLFMCPCPWFGVFECSFPKLPQYLSTCETGTIQLTEGPGTTVGSHLMWNNGLKALDFFSCDSVPD